MRMVSALELHLYLKKKNFVQGCLLTDVSPPLNLTSSAAYQALFISKTNPN